MGEVLEKIEMEQFDELLIVHQIFRLFHHQSFAL